MKLIPRRIIERPPSAELRPDQCDQDNLPDYAVLDAILEAYVEQNRSVQEIILWATLPKRLKSHSSSQNQ